MIVLYLISFVFGACLFLLSPYRAMESVNRKIVHITQNESITFKLSDETKPANHCNSQWHTVWISMRFTGIHFHSQSEVIRSCFLNCSSITISSTDMLSYSFSIVFQGFILIKLKSHNNYPFNVSGWDHSEQTTLGTKRLLWYQHS